MSEPTYNKPGYHAGNPEYRGGLAPPTKFGAPDDPDPIDPIVLQAIAMSWEDQQLLANTVSELLSDATELDEGEILASIKEVKFPSARMPREVYDPMNALKRALWYEAMNENEMVDIEFTLGFTTSLPIEWLISDQLKETDTLRFLLSRSTKDVPGSSDTASVQTNTAQTDPIDPGSPGTLENRRFKQPPADNRIVVMDQYHFDPDSFTFAELDEFLMDIGRRLTSIELYLGGEG